MVRAANLEKEADFAIADLLRVTSLPGRTDAATLERAQVVRVGGMKSAFQLQRVDDSAQKKEDDHGK